MDRLDVSHHLFAIAVANGTAPDWIQLTPNTETFSTRDGRGPFTIKDAASVIALSMQGGHVGIDYDHATDFVMNAKSGASAPAAGWIEELCAHGPNNEPGIWGRVKWTPRGNQAIADGDYRYVSPVLLSNKAGDLVAIGRAALTNDPALVMKSLFSQQENVAPMNRTQLCSMLGVPQNASDSDIAAAAKKHPNRKQLTGALGLDDTATDDDVMAAVKKVGPQASTLAAVERILEAAGLKGHELNDATTTALCAKLKQPVAASGTPDLQAKFDALQMEFASMCSRLNGRDAETTVTALIAAGKLQPAQKDWATDYCSRDPEGFAKFASNAPVIVGTGRITQDTPGEDGLTATEKAICAQTGVSHEDFKKTRATMKKEAA